MPAELSVRILSNGLGSSEISVEVTRRGVVELLDGGGSGD
jgi:hypothetical protein